MSMPANFVPIDWSTEVSDGTAVCSACDKTIPPGDEVQVRDGRRASIEAYPDDPSKFCVPCVTPEIDEEMVQ